MRIKILTLTESDRNKLTIGFRNGEIHCFRMRCRCVLLKSEGLSSARVGEQTEMTAQSVNGWVKQFEFGRDS
jgi:putative transposase